jgi:Fe-S-cluster containining protein
LPVRDSKRHPIPAIPALIELFSRLEAETAAFAGTSGLRCPDGCGACCESPNVYTSAVELEPLAEELVARGEAEAALDRAAAAGPGQCVFYASHGPGLGRCTVYALRPMICRLFGFAAVRDKQGQPELAGCRVHKAAQPEAMAHARALVAGGHPVPMMTDWQQRAAELGTSATGALVPINQAIQQALERALFAAALAGAGATSSPASDAGEPAVPATSAGDAAPVEPGPGSEPGARTQSRTQGRTQR